MYFLPFLIFLISCTIPSEYVCSLTKVDCSLKLPEDLQVQDLAKEWKLSKDFQFARDSAGNQIMFEKGKGYGAIFSNSQNKSVEFRNSFESLLCLGVTGNIVFKLDKGLQCFFAEVSFCGNDEIDLTKADISNETVNKIMKEEERARFDNEKVYCYPGSYGKFYFTLDDLANRRLNSNPEVYLFTVQKISPAIKSVTESAKSLGKSGWNIFFKKAFLIGGLLGMTVLLIILVSSCTKKHNLDQLIL